MNSMIPFLVLVLSVVGATASSAESTRVLPDHALAVLRRVPIQHNGRHKPFDSFARETITLITGSSRIDGQDPVLTVVSIMTSPDQWQSRPLIQVPFRPLRHALGMDPKASHVSQDALLATRTLMRMLPAIIEKQQRDEKLTMQEQETLDVFERFATFTSLVEHRLELVPDLRTDESWHMLQAPEGYPQATQAEIRQAWTAWVTAVREGHAQTIEATTTALALALGRLNPQAYPPRWRLELEVFYHWCGSFRLARFGYLVAALLLLVGLIRRLPNLAIIGERVFWVSAAAHVAGICMRVLIGGRPPVSNFFETMLWLPLVSVVVAIVLDWVYRVRYLSLSAACLAAITLWLSDYVPLDSSISPVVAVLRSNLWLTVHVLTIVASYGALGLATVLAHFYGAWYLGGKDRRTLKSLDLFLYRTLQVGVVLLAAGVMLGAVWANASWGRYWGWDPKETWALITLLWFLAVLHGRFAGWLDGVWVALATIAGFFLLLMTYYGVSFYLVGLHSYAGGHAKPLPLLLIGYLIAEAVFLGWVGMAATRRFQ